MTIIKGDPMAALVELFQTEPRQPGEFTVIEAAQRFSLSRPHASEVLNRMVVTGKLSKRRVMVDGHSKMLYRETKP